MKFALTSCVVALCAAVVPVSAQAVTESYQLNIPRQTLDAALKDLAQQTGLQIARFSDTPDGSALVGPVTGRVSIAQALNSLLTPSGLTYRIVNDRTIAVVPLDAGTFPPNSTSTHSENQANPTGNADAVENGQAQDGEELPQTTQAPPQTTEQRSQASTESQLEEVVVTGFRRSLEDSLEAKRANTNFTDSIFAEDIGKFPDQNLAESLQRLPGIQIERDASGEGTSINVRGLGSAFTTVSLNKAPIQTASDSNIDSLNQGRGLDLDLFPTELFRQLTISKSPRASEVEGGIAGTVDLRVVRPFDNEGFQFSHQVKGTYQEVSKEWSPRAAFFVSDTWDSSIGDFGLLGGVAYAQRKYRTDALGTINYTTFNLGNRCPSGVPGCNSQSVVGNATNPSAGYGGGATIPTTVPVNTGFGLVDGAPLTVCGPGGTSGLSCEQLSYAIVPRLVRAESLTGERERVSAVVTAEYRPLADMKFNLDLIYADAEHSYDRNDLMLAIRSTNNNVPIGMVLNDRNVVTHATFANAQLLAENRPYTEDTQLFNATFGMDYRITDRLSIDAQINYNASDWYRQQNTYMFQTPLQSGFAVVYDMPEGAETPHLSLNFDPNDVNLGWQWNAMRIQPAFRDILQRGARVNAHLGDESFMISGGVALDKFDRTITTWDHSGCAFNNSNCGPTSAVPSQYPGATTAIPNAQLGNFLLPWSHGTLYQNSSFDVGLNNGWAVPNYDLIDQTLHTEYFEHGIDPANRLNTLNPRIVDEETRTAYVELDGQTELLGRNVRWNGGIRFLDTKQHIAGIVNDPTLGRGIQHFTNDYFEYLPSVNAAMDLTEKMLLRVSGGRAMTRPAPGDLAPGQTLSVSGDTLTRGNPALEPFFSNQADLGLEYYFNRRNAVALNLWLKRVEGFTQIFRTRQRFDTLGIDFEQLIPATREGLLILGNGDPNAAIVNVDQRQNTEEIVRLTGVELNWLQALDFVLDGLGFNANYTRIDQKSTGAPQGAAGASNLGSGVAGLSPNTYNFTLFYEKRYISARTSYNYRDRYISFLGPQNNFPGDAYRTASKTLDASISVPVFAEALTITLEATNLLNEKQLTYIRGDDSLPYSAFAPGRQVSIGFRGRF